MPKGKGKAAFKGGRGSKPAAEDDAMAFKRSSRVNKITNARDAAFEGQDAFGLGDDEIALDGHSNAANGDFDDDLEEDEVLALNLSNSGRSYDEESADEHDAKAEAAPKQKKPRKNVLSNRARDLLPLESKTRTSRFEKPTASTSKLSSDESSEAADSSEEEEEGANEDAEEEFDNEWARTGGYHVAKREIARMEEQASAPGGKFSADEEAEQRDALELYEARRIQKESKDKLDETDYIDVEDLEENGDVQEDLLAVVRMDRQHRLPQAPTFESREEAIAHLLSKEPELLALLDDFSACSDRLPLVQEAVKQLKGAASNERKLGLGYLYQDALTTYLSLLAFYLHIRSHPMYPAVGAALADTVLGRLVRVRSSISSMEDFGVLDLPGDERRKDLYVDSDDEEGDLDALDRDSLLARIGDLDDDELDALIAERQAILEEQELAQSGTSKTKAKAGNKRKAISASSGSDEESDDDAAQLQSGKKKRRTRARKNSQNKATHIPLLNLEAPSVSKKSVVPVAAPSSLNDDFVDPTSLTADEVSEKAGKTKSLRFYTSKIAATSARRAGAGKERGGGDDDVPYRSKERAREAALRKQQHGTGEAPENTDLDTAGFDDADFALAQQVNDAAPAEDGYYDLVSSNKKAAKQAKKEAYEEATLGERAAIAAEQFDPNNPRAVNRMIMANKGLTPKRPKSVRNPRVKKRQKYEQAQKKVASMKPVYKGGLGSATYSGEKTGISSKVVKSRSL